MSVSVRIELDHDAIQRMLTSPGGLVVPWANDLGRRLLNQAQIECPVDTGRLRASHQMFVEVVGNLVTIYVGSDVNYAKFVHSGHAEIVKSRPMVFTPRGASKPVFAYRIRAVAPNPWLERALMIATGLSIQR